jgi:trans-aconitate methyltransferase
MRYNYDQNQILSWMDYLRNHPENRERFLECFWPSQLKSKEMLLSALPKVDAPDTMYVFGGWYGVFAQMLAEQYPYSHIISIDIDPKCTAVGQEISSRYPNVSFVTANMATYQYTMPPRLVINTSTEHVTQETYDTWWNNVPRGTQFYLQGNDYFTCYEHIRCSVSMVDFMTQCRIVASRTLHCQQLDCTEFTRYFVWGEK